MILRRDIPPTMAIAEIRAGRWERVRPGAYLVAEPAPAAGAARAAAPASGAAGAARAAAPASGAARAQGPKRPAGPAPSAAADSWAEVHRRALARIAAVDAQLTVRHVVSHESAALLWGLPLIGDGAVVHVIQSVAPHRGRGDVRRHRQHLGEDEVVELDGRRVTSLARTIADCACSLPARDGLVLADSALRLGLDRERCDEMLRRRVGQRGVRRAIEVLSLADDGAESPGESRLRHVLLRAGLPAPQTQVLVETDDGPAWGDLGWPEWRVLAEYDGVAKYTAESTAAAAVLRERRREVAIERQGWRVLRASAADLRRPGPLVAALLRSAPPAARVRLRPRPWLT
ncbi:hypothetical protein [Actinotalea sp.]|uniref:hypothetical protein n=1 Tax=Actinotalea sp. TaxID=1872145 RepID=UPI0035622A03